MCVRIYIFNFRKQTKKKAKANKKSKNTKKAKKTKEEKRISPENPLKEKQIFARPCEDFSRHSHFRKQEFVFFGLITKV